MSMWNSFIFAKLTIFSFVLIGVTACQAKEKIVIETPAGERQVFYVDLADTDEERAQGLMFVESMPEDEGMLFLYQSPQPTMFWMKNTLIPLDMLFFNDQNELVYIEKEATPLDLNPRGPANNNICTILEINGGMAEKLNIQTGAKLLSDLSQECLQSSIN